MFVQALIEDMQCNPQDYKVGQYEMINTKKCIRVWIANGFSFYEAEVPRQKFSLIEKWKFGRALKALCAHKVMKGAKC